MKLQLRFAAAFCSPPFLPRAARTPSRRCRRQRQRPEHVVAGPVDRRHGADVGRRIDGPCGARLAVPGHVASARSDARGCAICTGALLADADAPSTSRITAARCRPRRKRTSSSGARSGPTRPGQAAGPGDPDGVKPFAKNVQSALAGSGWLNDVLQYTQSDGTTTGNPKNAGPARGWTPRQRSQGVEDSTRRRRAEALSAPRSTSASPASTCRSSSSCRRASGHTTTSGIRTPYRQCGARTTVGSRTRRAWWFRTS